jgi:DNA-binding NtrC family response regulator
VYGNRILIVDDEPTLVFFLRRGLSEADLNCEVEGVRSGEEALARLTFDKYRVLITDLKMPGINGLRSPNLEQNLLSLNGFQLNKAFACDGGRKWNDCNHTLH